MNKFIIAKANIIRPLLAAGFALAMAFIFSCSSDDGNDNPTPPPAATIPSSGSGSGCTASNNTSTHYCSNGTMKQYGSMTDDGGRAYKTVVIGEQTWMAENMNYNVSGSKCGVGCIESLCNLSDENTSICDTYGRLYDWVTARGICPSGWHIPNNAELDKLLRYVDGTSGTESPYDSRTAGKYLKAASGWNDNGNGEDKFGFTALPGGDGGGSTGFFGSFGKYGIWWSASEYNADRDRAYYLSMFYNSENANWWHINKNALHSVRCLQDDSGDSPGSSSTGASSSSGGGNSSSSSGGSSGSYCVVASIETCFSFATLDGIESTCDALSGTTGNCPTGYDKL